jgi:hypothetical protein
MPTTTQHDGSIEGRVTSLEIRVAVAESDIKNVKADITSIKDDTRWLRRAITNTLIVGTIGGALGVVFYQVQYIMTKK